MKLVHHADKCEGHGVCEAIDPDRFELGADDALIVRSTEVSDEDLPLMRRAVDSCPRQALSLEEQ